MGYLVLARKYRPDTFEAVLGQEPVARTLQNALKIRRLAHAYLFTGPRGVGKTSMARILARALMCETGPTPSPCGTCERCVSVRAGNDLDVLEIDGASNRGIENIRDLRESVRYSPSKGRYKVYIVDEVHQITNDAFNAFLKTLEEPPEHVVFVFATTEPSKVPETIRSRCQEFEFRRIPDQRIAQHVQALVAEEGLELEEGMEWEVARHARGGLRDALSLLDQLAAYGEGKITFEAFRELTGYVAPDRVRELFDALIQEDGAAALAWVAEATDRGSSAGDLIDQILRYARALLHRRVGSDRIPELAGVDPDCVGRHAEALDEGHLVGFLQVLVQGRRSLREVEDERLILDMMVLSMLRIGQLPALNSALQALGNGGGATPARVARPAARPSPEARPARAAAASPRPAPANPPRTAISPAAAGSNPTSPQTPPPAAVSSGPPAGDAVSADQVYLAAREALVREAPSLLAAWKKLEPVDLTDEALIVRPTSGHAGAALDQQRLDPILRAWSREKYGRPLVARLEQSAEKPRDEIQEAEPELRKIQGLFGGETVSE